jgi:hypothetical protein
MQYKDKFCVPRDISEHLKSRNELTIDLLFAKDCRLVIAFAIGTKVTPSEIIKSLKSVDEKLCREQLMKTFNNGIGIQEQFIQFSLKCPIQGRMKTPVRGKHCVHFQCFEVENYVMQNDASHIWSCPLCKKECKPQDLYIDSYFQRLLREETDENKVTVRILPDGKVEYSDPLAMNKRPVDVIILDSDEEDGNPPPKYVKLEEDSHYRVTEQDIKGWFDLFVKQGYLPGPSQLESFSKQLNVPLDDLKGFLSKLQK